MAEHSTHSLPDRSEIGDSAEAEPKRHLAEWLRQLDLVHQVPGRIRVRLRSASEGRLPLDAGRLQSVLSNIEGLTQVRLNPLARSCVIEYDRSSIPDAAWPDLFEGRSTALAHDLLDRIASRIPVRVPLSRHILEEETP